MKLVILAVALAQAAAPVSDPYAALTPDEKTALKPQVERWVRDQTKRDWADMWEMQDQTSELKNELLLGRRDAPDRIFEQCRLRSASDIRRSKRSRCAKYEGKVVAFGFLGAADYNARRGSRQA
jgi:hypothetical protein